MSIPSQNMGRLTTLHVNSGAENEEPRPQNKCGLRQKTRLENNEKLLYQKKKLFINSLFNIRLKDGGTISYEKTKNH